MLYIHLCWVVLVLFQVLSDAEKLASLRLFPNTPTPNASFMSDVEKEETKWLKYLKSSQTSTLSIRERNIVL